MTAHFLRDTDICIYALSRRSESVLARMDRLKSGEAQMSTIVYGELAFGASKSRASELAWVHLKSLATVVEIVALPVAAAGHYAEIRRELESRGTPIGNNDLWIAAHALASGLILVTNNEREFRRVPGLKIQNWAR